VEHGTALASAIEKFRQVTEVRKAAAVKRSERTAEKRRRTDAEKAEQEAAERAEFLTEHADLWAFLESAGGDCDTFYGSLRGQWEHKGYLSERQVEALHTAIRKSAERAEREAIEALTAKPAPVGTQTVEGVVVHVRDQEGYHGDIEWKMLVKCDGYKVWCTVPRSLDVAYFESHSGAGLVEWLTARTVRFTATLTVPNDAEPSFAIAKRPRNALILEAVAA
jgi:hypothetical protein